MEISREDVIAGLCGGRWPAGRMWEDGGGGRASSQARILLKLRSSSDWMMECLTRLDCIYICLDMLIGRLMTCFVPSGRYVSSGRVGTLFFFFFFTRRHKTLSKLSPYFCALVFSDAVLHGSPRRRTQFVLKSVNRTLSPSQQRLELRRYRPTVVLLSGDLWETSWWL